MYNIRNPVCGAAAADENQGGSMSLQFIIGSSGSGKTHRLYQDLIERSVREPQSSFIAIVPEQFTMQTQKQIVTMHPDHGTMNIDIVSFNRLAYRVFEELAVEHPAVLDDMGKSMVLRKVAAEQKKNLQLYGGHLNQTGFINQLKSMLSELYQYGIRPEVLDEVADQAESALLKAKCGDLAVMFRAFQKEIDRRFITAEEILDVLCRVLPESELIRRSVITLDGYTGFTPVQYRLLELMMIHARQVIVTVGMDPAAGPYQRGRYQNLFYMGKEMIAKLTELAAGHGVERDEDVLLGAGCGKAHSETSGETLYRFRRSPSIAYIEKHLYRYDGSADWEPREVEVWQASGPSDEAAAVASRICELVRQESVRYREIAVITGDLAGYRHEIVSRFQAEGIPFFMDNKKSILENAMVEFIRAGLEAVRRDFDYESVFRYLKTGLAAEMPKGRCGREERNEAAEPMTREERNEAAEPVTREQRDKAEEPETREERNEAAEPVTREQRNKAAEPETWEQQDGQEELDRLENYCVALGIRGFKRWSETWEYTYRGAKNLNLDQLNAFRQEILKPMTALREAMRREDRTVRTMNEAVTAWLEECRVEEKLNRYREDFEKNGEFALAKEYEQIYGRVTELFDRLTGLLGDEKLSLKEYMEILDAGFAEIRVGVIPATVDRVTVGDITRTRLDQIRVLFFVGVNEGVVPSRKDAQSLLTDMDREVFKRFRVQLAPTSKEDSFTQRYYLYLLLTKPSERLVLSYSLLDAAGKSRRPSGLIGELCRMFPRLAVRETQGHLGEIVSKTAGKEFLVRGLREYAAGSGSDPDLKDGRRFLALYRWFAANPEYSGLVKKLTDAAFYSYDKRGVSRAAARALYGQVMQGSVTRLEQYAACAYAHFLNYGLELMERQEYRIAAVDMGNLFHSSIDLCFKEMDARGLKAVRMDEEQRKALVRECVAKVTSEYGSSILMDSARNRYLADRIERMTERTIWALTEQLRKGDFEPAGYEVSFSAIDNLKAMKIRLSDEEALHLRGRIDRLDLCEDGQQVYVKIIDYKSGGTQFDLAAVYYGLQLQLVVYMDAVMELTERSHPGKNVMPAGIFYYNIKDPLIDREAGQTPEDVDSEILKQLRMNGLVNSDLDSIRHLDSQIREKSDVIPVAMKDGLIQESQSSVASGRRFEVLRRYVRGQLKKDGREILSGQIGAEPQKSGGHTACDYCPYHGVCGFDTRIAGYRYRRFAPVDAEQVWEKMEETCGGNVPSDGGTAPDTRGNAQSDGGTAPDTRGNAQSDGGTARDMRGNAPAEGEAAENAREGGRADAVD